MYQVFRLLLSFGLALLIVTAFMLIKKSDKQIVSTSKLEGPTKQEKLLFNSLKARGLPVELQKFDGHKTIDIAIPIAKLNIEVDGIQHHKKYKQALADLERTYYSLEKGFITIRVPNSLVVNELETTADIIEKIYDIQINK